LGTAFLLATVIGSGIMGVRLAAGNDAVALLANSIATGGALYALILTFAPISGAHFNPVVTLFEFAQRRISAGVALVYIAAQVAGAIGGVILAHAMFGIPLVQVSGHVRSSGGELIGEIVATLGLLLIIWSVARTRPDAVAGAVATYITGAYWFTSSTSFANPAVTLARAASNTFAGIRPDDMPAFIAAQILGALAAWVVMRWLTARAS